MSDHVPIQAGDPAKAIFSKRPSHLLIDSQLRIRHFIVSQEADRREAMGYRNASSDEKLREEEHPTGRHYPSRGVSSKADAECQGLWSQEHAPGSVEESLQCSGAVEANK